jgi:uncharacterized LabA/DUF88 family protein
MKKQNNFAFIDSQNLVMSFKDMGWMLDYQRFRVYLSEKYHVTKAYLFIGFIGKNSNLYRSLQEKGYVLIFKPTLKYKDGTVKGNCDAELVLQAMIDYKVYHQAVIITGDGDFHCLVQYLIENNKLQKLLIPNQKKYSALLKRFPSGSLSFLSDLKKKVAYKKKEPRKDEP